MSTNELAGRWDAPIAGLFGRVLPGERWDALTTEEDDEIPERPPVRVRGAHEPERHTAQRLPPQPRHDRLAGRLVAVHVAHHQHVHRRGRVPDPDRRDRAPLHGVPDDEAGEGGGEQHRK